MPSSYDESARALYPEKSEHVPIRFGPNAELGQSSVRGICEQARTSRITPNERATASEASPSGPPTPRVSWNALRANARHLGLLPRGVSRHRLSPLGRFAPPARCGCRGTRRGRRNLPRIRRPWVISRRKPSPSGHFAASAGRPRPKIGRGPASRRHGPSDRDLCKDR